MSIFILPIYYRTFTPLCIKKLLPFFIFLTDPNAFHCPLVFMRSFAFPQINIIIGKLELDGIRSPSSKGGLS